MKIKLSNAGKRFNREWIFRKATVEFLPAASYAITGPNGSGKSTFLQTIGGMIQVSEGAVTYSEGEKETNGETVFKNISFCAPYLDVIEEMTLQEFFQFHFSFKPFLPGLSFDQMVETIGLQDALHKQIRYFSSGMKQRVKLAQAIFSDTAVVLLDEPCTNLDKKGIDLYHALVHTYCANRLVIVSSNDEVEYSFCNERIAITQFKSNVSSSIRR